MVDSGKYDLSTHELQPFLLGLLTAVHIDAPTASKYWTDTFPEYPDIPEDDLPSYIRLYALVIGALLAIINGFREVPVTRPFVEGILDALRTGDVWDAES